MTASPTPSRSPVARVYDRVAPLYDLYTSPMERMGGLEARRRLLARARGRVLEVGVGTGLGLEHYPPGVELTGLDISPRMLQRARRRAERLGRQVELVQGDAEHLDFPDDSFDTVTATCVFCSVADPVRGLRELRRVVRPDGQVLLYEHVRPRGPVMGPCSTCSPRSPGGCSGRASIAAPKTTSGPRACGSSTSTGGVSGGRSPPLRSDLPPERTAGWVDALAEFLRRGPVPRDWPARTCRSTGTTPPLV